MWGTAEGREERMKEQFCQHGVRMGSLGGDSVGSYVTGNFPKFCARRRLRVAQACLIFPVVK